jgi:purine-binding chemotaxis protein CheW
MTERQSRCEDAETQADDTDDVFVRLRQCLKAMRNDDRGHVDPAVLAKKLADRAQVLRGRSQEAKPTGPQMSFLAFCHGAQRYGIPISDIVEVQPLSDYTLVPQAPRFIVGVIHWRGAILSLIDLGKLFGVSDPGLIDERACVIVEAAKRRIGVSAGEVEELHTVSLKQMKSAPDLPTDIPRDWVAGVVDQNRLILRMDQILDDQRLTEWRERRLSGS